MAEFVEFQTDDGLYLFCVGQSVTFDTAWEWYCFIDRLCFSEQRNEPAFADERAKLLAAVQRGISSGLILLSESGELSQSPELQGRFEALRAAGLNEFDAAEKLEETFLLSRRWEVVCDAKLTA